MDGAGSSPARRLASACRRRLRSVTRPDRRPAPTRRRARARARRGGAPRLVSLAFVFRRSRGL